MKNCIKFISVLLCAATMFASCKKEEQEIGTFSTDVPAITEVPCQGPITVSVALTTNTNWIVITPEWVHANPVFGSGNSIVEFTVDNLYINENSDVEGRSGEIVFSGGKASYKLPISQLGYAKPFDASASKGGITTLDDLLEFAQTVNTGGSVDKWCDQNGEVLLLEDITIPDGTEWDPVGNSTTTAFKKVFNGNGKKISGISIKATAAAGAAYGFFGFIADKAVVKNLTVEVKDITVEANAAKFSVGGIVGCASDNAEITNCTVNALTDATNILVRITGGSSTATYEGGIVGQLTAKKVEGCTNNCPVKVINEFYDNNGANGVHTGGIVGWTNTPDGATVAKCTNNAKLGGFLGDERAGSSCRFGGIVGTGQGLVNVTECTNNGEVIGTNVVTTDLSSRTSGIIAYTNLADCQIISCVNNGDISFGVKNGEKTYLGYVSGIVGQTAKLINIEKCENYGAVITDNIYDVVGKSCTGIIVSRPNNTETTITDCKVGGKIGPLSEPDKVVTLSAGNFMDYLAGDAQRNVKLIITNCTFASK